MENVRGSLLMVAAMAGFALEDMLIKQLAATLPMGEIIALLGVGGSLIFATMTRVSGQRVWSRAVLSRPLLLRNLGEMTGTACYVSAIVLTTLSSASAILQALPLAATLGAALFFGESVGWRRLSAIVAGLVGVILVLQPGLAGFEPASLFAVGAVAGLALRDLSVRRIPATISAQQVSVWGFATLMPTGLLMLLAMGETPVLPSTSSVGLLLAAFAASGCGYYSLVGATRTGEVAVVVPYRYSRLLFALILGALVFGERPDALTLGGSALIVVAGLYTMWREARLRARARARSEPASEYPG